jgi:hypothetical protein
MDKTPVTFIGFQLRLSGPAFALVNEPSGSTVKYDPKRHMIINSDFYRSALVAEWED